jgi:hypothetical protein
MAIHTIRLYIQRRNFVFRCLKIPTVPVKQGFRSSPAEIHYGPAPQVNGTCHV